MYALFLLKCVYVMCALFLLKGVYVMYALFLLKGVYVMYALFLLKVVYVMCALFLICLSVDCLYEACACCLRETNGFTTNTESVNCSLTWWH